MNRINIPGVIGRGYKASNAGIVDVRHSYNGSGKEAFGGARSWPRVDASVEFQEHESRRALQFARKLAKLIHEELGT